MSGNPRRVALDLLREVRERDAYANLRLPELIAKAGLDSRDAAFATELAYGTLRWQALYDAIAAHCATRPWESVDPELIDVIRLGAHQLLNMRVPVHAAVDTSCSLVHGKGPTGFVNAVLRCIAQHTREQWVEHLGLDRATQWSHPGWILRTYQQVLPAAEIPELLAANNTPARPTLVARPGRAEAAELVELGATPGRWSPYAGVLTAGSPDDLAAVREGRIGVQDEGSQLVTLALTRVPVPQPETAWLDMCAGPGGKSALLVGLAGDVPVIAVEPHAHRAQLVEASAPGAHVLVGDARTKPWGDQLFDRVLVDAPCTGIGALRRRPDARWRRSPKDLSQLVPLQHALLETAIQATKPGGVIGYVTCSPHPAETVDVVRDATGVEILNAPEYLPEVPDLAGSPFIQLWPHRHGTDAMFAALLRRE
jgi:16S rRNA (cytosine967-C5)-methyltransferase